MRILWRRYKRVDFDLNLDECGIHQCTYLNKYSYVVENAYMIHYVMQGIGYLQVENQRFKLEKGDAFIVKKGMKISYYPDKNDPWKYCWIAFSGVLADKYLTKYDFTNTCKVSFATTESLPNLLIAFTEELKDETNDNELFRLSHLYPLFYELCKKLVQPKVLENKENILNHNLEKAIQYINKNYQQPIKVTDVCEEINVTRSYLYKIFTQNLKISPQEYLGQLRLFKACELLKNSAKSIKEITFLVGYTDQLYFSAKFKKAYGVAPKKYRQMSRQK
jgi:AraC-like DNA-binding protein